MTWLSQSIGLNQLYPTPVRPVNSQHGRHRASAFWRQTRLLGNSGIPAARIWTASTSYRLLIAEDTATPSTSTRDSKTFLVAHHLPSLDPWYPAPALARHRILILPPGILHVSPRRSSSLTSLSREWPRLNHRMLLCGHSTPKRSASSDANFLSARYCAISDGRLSRRSASHVSTARTSAGSIHRDTRNRGC